MQQSLPLILPASTPGEIVLGNSNYHAWQLLMERKTIHSPITLLCGDKGSGKTALAQQWSAKCNGFWLHHIPEDSFLSSFRKGFYVLDPLYITAEKEQFLFHLLNLVRETGSMLLICSRQHPASLPVTLADLSSRLKGANVLTLFAPDDDMLHALLMQYFSEKQLRVEPHVIDYLLRRMPRSYEAVKQMGDALDRISLESKRSITTALAREVLHIMDNQTATV